MDDLMPASPEERAPRRAAELESRPADAAPLDGATFRSDAAIAQDVQPAHDDGHANTFASDVIAQDAQPRDWGTAEPFTPYADSAIAQDPPAHSAAFHSDPVT